MASGRGRARQRALGLGPNTGHERDIRISEILRSTSSEGPFNRPSTVFGAHGWLRTIAVVVRYVYAFAGVRDEWTLMNPARVWRGSSIWRPPCGARVSVSGNRLFSL